MDPISEMLITIKNGLNAKKDKVEVPFSAFKLAILNIFKEKGLIRSAKKINKNLIIKLKYNGNDSRIIKDIKIISSPSRRIYVGNLKIPRIKSGYGFVIVSTSKGVMDGSKAKKMGIGGELICKVW
jgi:small subunit ribosomal protein S8